MTELARFLPFINILFYSAALKWVLNLEKYQCKCSADKRRDIMKYYLMFGIAFSVFGCLAIFDHDMMFFLAHSLAPLFFLMSIAYSAVALSYLVDIKHRDCRCSMGPQREFMYWLAIAQVILSGLIFFAFLAKR